MKPSRCDKCGRLAPEGYSLCAPCMRAADTRESEIQAVAALMDITSIINMGDTDASQRTAIEGILSIAEREGITI